MKVYIIIEEEGGTELKGAFTDRDLAYKKMDELAEKSGFNYEHIDLDHNEHSYQFYLGEGITYQYWIEELELNENSKEKTN